MCGRYTLVIEMGELVERFGCSKAEMVFKPRYNVAPTQFMPVVVSLAGRRKLQSMHWGLVPNIKPVPNLMVYPGSNQVSSPRNDDPRCMQPIK